MLRLSEARWGCDVVQEVASIQWTQPHACGAAMNASRVGHASACSTRIPCVTLTCCILTHVHSTPGYVLSSRALLPTSPTLTLPTRGQMIACPCFMSSAVMH